MCEHPLLIFDVAANRPTTALAIAVACALASGVVFKIRARLAGRGPVLLVIAILMLATASLVVLYLWDLRRWESAVSAAKQGLVVDGIVRNFLPEPVNGHSRGERFTV